MPKPAAKKETKVTKKTKLPASSEKRTSARAKSSVQKPAFVKASVKEKKSMPAKKKAASEIIEKPVKNMPSEQAKSVKETAYKPQTVKVRKTYVIWTVIIILLGILLYYYRGLFVAAVVNGQPISRLSVVQETEKESGKQALSMLVRNTLIEQEADKEHVTVSDSDVSNQINTVKANLAKQGESLDSVLASQGMTMGDLRSLLRLDLLVQKMVGKQIVISNKEINAYIATNQNVLPQNESKAQLRSTVKQQLQQQELNEKTQTWLTNLQNNAQIIYFVQY